MLRFYESYWFFLLDASSNYLNLDPFVTCIGNLDHKQGFHFHLYNILLNGHAPQVISKLAQAFRDIDLCVLVFLVPFKNGKALGCQISTYN